MRVLQRVFKGRGRQQLKPLAQIIAGLFKSGAPGTWYDPSDINLNWRYNLLTYTEQFDNAVWFKSGVSVSANTQETADPIGGNTADKLLETSTTTAHYIDTASAISVVSGSVYTRSISIKYLGRQWVALSIYDTANRYTYFDLQNGVVGTNAAGTTATIVSQGNGWYRCTISRTVTAATIYNATLTAQSDGGSVSFAGDSTKGIYIWGASLTTAANASLPYQQIVTPEISYLNYQPQPILYQDSAGTTPVTAVEQPVGLMLDKSQGLVLGPQLVTNGDFSNGSTGWTLDAAATVSGGTLNISTAISLVAASQTFSLTAGKMYEVRATCTSRTSGVVGIGTKTGATVSAFTITAAGDYRAYIFAGTSNDGIRIFSTGSGFTGSIDNISVKELPGNHAFQSTAASRPVLSARYNLWTNTETLATQNRTVRAAKHIISFSGTGTVTLSGAFSGSLVGTGANNRVYLEFTTTAGTLTATVSGSVTKAQLEEV